MAACGSSAAPSSPDDLAAVLRLDASIETPADGAAPDLSLVTDASALPDMTLPPDAATNGQPSASFRFAVAGGIHMLYYDYVSLEPAVDALAPAAFTIQLAGDDIARYRVEKQSPSPRVELVLTPAAAKRVQGDPNYGYKLAGAYCDLRLEGMRQYVAFGWDRIGAAAILTPVVHAETVGGQFVLRIGVIQGAWYGWGNFGAGEGRIDLAALRAYFRSRGALDEVAQLSP